MIVMNPNQITWQDNFGQFVGKMLVDAEISSQIAPRELSKIDAVMQDGPQNAVSEPTIVFLIVLLC